MAVTSNGVITIRFTEDIVASLPFEYPENTDSPAEVEIKTLAIGANTITPPGGGSTPTGVLIIPPSGNVSDITLKGVTGDTGVLLSLLGFAFISLGSPSATFVLTAEAEIVGVRLIWV